MLVRILQSVLVAVAVALVCLLVGAVLTMLKVDVAVAVGGFLKSWATLIGVLAGIWFFLTGRVF